MASKKPIGLAIVGCGVIGRMRGTIASDYPGIGWIGLSDMNEKVGNKLKDDIKADFFTTDYRELINRPEVDALIVATSTWAHVEPTLLGCEKGIPMLIEKPLATDARQSFEVLAAIKKAKVDACVGYTQRFRRRFLVVKSRVDSGQIGELTCLVTRAFMNRMAPMGEVRLTQDRRHLTPMVVSGTHSLDMCRWIMGPGQKPVSIYARSQDKVMGEHGTKDATFGIFQMESGAIWSMNICWALPKVWPGAVYGLEIGIVGTKGVIDIEDTHRDLVHRQREQPGPGLPARGPHRGDRAPGRVPDQFPPGDVYDGELWGPLREETWNWYQRIYMGKRTPHATAEEAHDNLMLTMAMDLSAKRGKEVKLPIAPEELMAGLSE